MAFLGIECTPAIKPELDPDFIPLHKFNQSFLNSAAKPVAIAVDTGNGQLAVKDTFIHGTTAMAAADCYYIERLIKTMLWQKGGHKVIVCGDHSIYKEMARIYSPDGARSFDYHFMARVYEKPFEVCYLDLADKPAACSQAKSVGRHLAGCRIGFDAGGSDRKVSSVIDGQAVFSEETIWHPKEQADPEYHYRGILDSLEKAASKMPRVDAIGISSAGIYINNRTMVASLFIKVPDNEFETKIKDIYIRAAREIGPDIPVEVCNDGDVTALAGAMSLEANKVLGIAMGTSEAGGYVDSSGNITGWLNELAFVPIDANPGAMIDEWSGDIGCGVKYFSQDGVIKLAPRAGIDLSAGTSPAAKLVIVQELMAKNDPRARKVYESIGCCLGHTLAYYDNLYSIGQVLLLGRVMSGSGGDIILTTARHILAVEYPEVKLQVSLPDEKFRRVGQSVAAASLPQIR